MRKTIVLSVLLSVCVTGLGYAQDDTQTCWDCVIGLFDTAALESNVGTWDTNASPSKTFYLGIRYDPVGSFDGLTGIEFSIQGLPQTLLAPSITIRDGGIKFGDNIQTPADTTAPDAAGGWNVVWSECQPGNRVMVEITLISFDPIPNDTVIRVLRKFPPSNETVPHSLFTMCNFPLFSKVRARGGCYVLNPSGGPVDCGETAVSPSTWSVLKQLYR